MSDSDEALQDRIEQEKRANSFNYGHEAVSNNTPKGYMTSSTNGGGSSPSNDTNNNNNSGEINYNSTSTPTYFTGRSCW